MKAKSGKKFKVLKHLDENNNLVSYRVEYTDAKRPLPIPVSFTDAALSGSRRGATLECILANEIKRYAKDHPDDFPDGFVLAHVERRCITIITKRAHRKKFPNHPVGIRYMADVGHILDAFDNKEITPAQFRKMFGDGMTLYLRRAKSRGGEEKPHARDTRERAAAVPGRLISATRGAYRRARNAGLLLPT